MNENLDHLHPSGHYVLVNNETGSVVWFDNHDEALCAQSRHGGTLFDPSTADPDLLKRILDNAHSKR